MRQPLRLLVVGGGGRDDGKVCLDQAAGAEDVLVQLGKGRYDLVLCGGQSTDDTAVQLLRQVRQHDSCLPVVFLGGPVQEKPGRLAHDFNNLLLVISAHAELMLDSLPEGDVLRRNLGAIMSASRRAAELTRQLLTEPAELSPRRCETVLLVEDDGSVRLASGQFLTQSGCKVLEASEARAAGTWVAGEESFRHG